MRSDKHERMLAAYRTGGGLSCPVPHDGPRTVDAVCAGIPAALWGRLTGVELGLVMAAIHAAYQRGRAGAGTDDDLAAGMAAAPSLDGMVIVD